MAEKVWTFDRVEAFVLWLRAAGRMDAQDVQNLGEALAFLTSMLMEHGRAIDDLVEAQALVDQQRATIEHLLVENDDLRAKLYVQHRQTTGPGGA